ncbi:hypothetical protein KIH41_11735 [Litoribacter ruber]|uniref:PepSY domain-containing protein n=1 Tax=Litoribacter ruber TaxID=702568 RepID=A0AAP2CJI7_9BACT|nr:MULTISPECIES: hypothetical protein [Litoribacter]MBS9524889.1 hypothetical protein [Litoribacter alkaliphilus]MBT0811950.1 hypothetical protein [Litoribacter ruber]
MKKGLLVLALCGFAFVGVQAQTTTPPTEPQTEINQDRVKIAPDDLPQAVRNSISEKDDVRDLRITEAYQVTNMEGELHYEVHFDKAGEAVTKKYDAQGNEVRED